MFSQRQLLEKRAIAAQSDAPSVRASSETVVMDRPSVWNRALPGLALDVAVEHRELADDRRNITFACDSLRCAVRAQLRRLVGMAIEASPGSLYYDNVVVH